MRAAGCLLVMLCCFDLCAGEAVPAPAAEEQRAIETLIAQLDSEEFEIRERATRELKSRGDVALAPLKAVCAKTKSAEVLARAKSVIKLIERREVGGAVVNGFQLALFCARKEYSASKDEMVELELEFRRVKDDAKLKGSKVEVSWSPVDADAIEQAALTVDNDGGSLHPSIRKNGRRAPEEIELLKALLVDISGLRQGQAVARTITIECSQENRAMEMLDSEEIRAPFQLAPGEYEIAFVWRWPVEEKKAKPEHVDIRSNSVKVTVRE
jgi:hypothetical protein